MSRLAVMDTPIAGLKLVERQMLGDKRGFLARLFCADELAVAGWQRPIAQINHTATQKSGTIRGMHFQYPPHAEMKLVTCLHGAVWDVAVDLRAGSATFLHWHAEELSAANRRAFLIPEGFAHGFQTLEDDSELVYLHSAAYHPGAESGLNPFDPSLAIPWPREVRGISTKDASRFLINAPFEGIVL